MLLKVEDSVDDQVVFKRPDEGLLNAILYRLPQLLVWKLAVRVVCSNKSKDIVFGRKFCGQICGSSASAY